MKPASPSCSFRSIPVAADLQRLRKLLEATEFFYAFEVDVALELLADRLQKGGASEYSFLFAEAGGVTVGFSCFGPITVTDRRFDLYWIAIDPASQGQGLGAALLAETERRVREAGGLHLVVETSSRPLYEPTRQFYLRRGYPEVARVPNYYSDGDDRVIYMKKLE